MLLPFRPLPPSPMSSPVRAKANPRHTAQPPISVRTSPGTTWAPRRASPAPDSPSSPLQSPTSSRPNSRPTTPSEVHSAVSRLLGLIKQLQEVLQLWGARQATETQVSDAFVLVGSQFNTTVNVFWRYGVDMSDLFHHIVDLRQELETCLGEDPSPLVLESYLPQVRRVIFHLLTDLRAKQGPYWDAVSGHRRHAHPS